jgi:hypothetical protein
MAGESVEADGRRKAIHEGDVGRVGRGGVRVEVGAGQERGRAVKGRGRKRQGGEVGAKAR